MKITQGHGFGSDAPSNALFFTSFTTSMGNFTIKDVAVPEQLPCIWEFSSQYKCMKATAFINPNNYASESWLISPDITLPAGSQSYLTFEHAGGYFGKASEEATVWVQLLHRCSQRKKALRIALKALSGRSGDTRHEPARKSALKPFDIRIYSLCKTVDFWAKM